MNKKIMAAMALGVLMVAAIAAYGTYTSPRVSEGLRVTGWVAVTVVRDGLVIYNYESHNLITTAGKDYISAQIGSTAPGANGANYVGLSLDVAAPAAADTILAGEIGSGGLGRAQGTYSHTVGTNTYTVQKQFTASATHTGVQKAGLFTASAAGTMMAENTFSSVNLVSGDQITITWTITIA